MTVLYRDLPLGLNAPESLIPRAIERRLRLPRGAVRDLVLLKRSLDSRGGRRPRFVYTVAFALDAPVEQKLLTRRNPLVATYRESPAVVVPRLAAAYRGPRPVIIGAGPAGLFAAHRLLEGGVAPLLLERGPEVTERSKRWAAFLRGGTFDPECNLLFGEGGAGAYSDGKLYTRVSDPRAPEVLRIFARHGAPAEILHDAHPHVGSNLLPSIIRRMRGDLIARGAEVRFSTRAVDLELAGAPADGHRQVRGVVTDPGGAIETSAVFLGTGHSARDVYRWLHARGIAIEPKPFQMGVRVEHPQALIDRIQYGEAAGHPRLPPAEYQLVAKRPGGDVFSFCMCPGGEILPATELPGFICVNGASPHKRIGAHANSGFVLTIHPEEFPEPHGPLAGLALQEQVERDAARAAGVPFAVPALRLTDFLEGRVSENLPESSYPFPLVPASFDDWMPAPLLAALREGLAILGRRMRGFLTADALVVAPESRSSSPLRIVRDPETLESISAHGLYPMGEGAGFAGGILSAAIDGMRAAEAWLRAVGATSVSGGRAGDAEASESAP